MVIPSFAALAQSNHDSDGFELPQFDDVIPESERDAYMENNKRLILGDDAASIDRDEATQNVIDNIEEIKRQELLYQNDDDDTNIKYRYDNKTTYERALEAIPRAFNNVDRPGPGGQGPTEYKIQGSGSAYNDNTLKATPKSFPNY
jgi:hypothetical protein